MADAEPDPARKYIPPARVRSAFQTGMMVLGGMALGWAFRDFLSAGLDAFARSHFPAVAPSGPPLWRQFAMAGVQALIGTWFFNTGFRARVLKLPTSQARILVGVALVWAMILLTML